VANESPSITEELRGLPAPSSQVTPATQSQILQARYELVYLIFQFLVSLAVLVGAFLVIVTYNEPQAIGGAVAVSTVVVTYWFGAKRDFSVTRH